MYIMASRRASRRTAPQLADHARLGGLAAGAEMGMWTGALWWLAASTNARADEPPSSASAGSSSVTLHESFQLKYRRIDQRLPDPADVPIFDYVEQINRLVTTASSGAWTFGVQVDEVALFANRYYFVDELVVERDLVLDGTPNVFPMQFDAYVVPEKARAEVTGEWGQLLLGDAYAAFGRGVALNLNRNVDIDVDTSIQGARALLRPGSWDVTVIAGQANRQQVFQDNPNGGIRGDLRHLVVGARAERYGLGPANLGAHAVVFDFVETAGWAGSVEGLGGPDAAVFGLTTELALGGLDLYVESDGFAYGRDHPSPLGEGASDLGYAVYGSAAAYPGPLVVLLEGKRYLQAERVNASLATELYEVATAPSLEYERVILEDSTATLNSNDVWGGRVEVAWSAIPGELAPSLAMGVFRDVDTTGLHFNDVPETVFHPLIGTEWIASEIALLANAGYRHDERDGSQAGADRLAHGDVTFDFPLPGRLSADVSLAALRFWWGINGELQQAPFSQAETSYSLTWGGKVTATWSLDYTTNPLVDTTGNLSENLYTGGQLQLKLGSDLVLKAFYGVQKAGIRCAGGQCRKLPGFDGAQVSLLTSL